MFEFLSTKFSSVFTRLVGANQLNENNIADSLQKIKDVLLEADVPHQIVEQFLQEVTDEVIGKKIVKNLKAGEQFIKIVHEKLLQFLGGRSDQEFKFQKHSIIMLLGLQGSGKTTTLAKLAHLLQHGPSSNGARVLLASVDFNRPAARDQLEVLAKSVGCAFYKSIATTPLEAAKEVCDYYKKNAFDYLLLDTAGRMHIDALLIEELRQVDMYIKPRYKIVALDAMLGQESLSVAQSFQEGVGFDAAILTKMDSGARGGVAFAFRYYIKKPVLFVGVGEKIDDLELFRPERVANRIIGVGDIQSLIEKAESKIKKADQDDLERSLKAGKLTLNDFAKQMDMMNKIGSLSQVLKYLPGMPGMTITPEMIQKGEQEMKRFKAIISSMTMKERLYPALLDKSRKERVAKGAGVKVAEVNALLARFEQTQQFVKLFKRMG